MDQVTGQVERPVGSDCDVVLRGCVKGDLRVAAGFRMTLEGVVTGNLVVEAGGAAVIYGTVAGTLINLGADVVVHGTVNSVHDYGDKPTRFSRNAKLGYERAARALDEAV